jgi:hypothetical protein
MARPKRSTAELVDASEHLRYEMDMLVETAKELESGNSRPDVITNALVESFAVHTRALVAFFYPDTHPTWDNDVIAADYAPQWPGKPSESATLSDAYVRASKEIAHLTYTRLSVPVPDKPWDPRSIVQEITRIISSFLQHVQDTDISAELLEYKKQGAKPKTGSVRIIKGPAVYHTSSFSPPTPLGLD